MVSERQLQASLIQIVEALSDLGDVVTDTLEPDDLETDEEQYYILAESDGSNYYIATTVDANHATVVYPLNTARALGERLKQEEQETILSSISDEIPEDEGHQHEAVGNYILDRTPKETSAMARFNIAAFGTTSNANIRMDPEGDITRFPSYIQCTRNLFPFTEKISMRELNDRVMSVIISGKNAKRYFNSSVHITPEDGTELDETDPVDYSLGIRF